MGSLRRDVKKLGVALPAQLSCLANREKCGAREKPAGWLGHVNGINWRSRCVKSKSQRPQTPAAKHGEAVTRDAPCYECGIYVHGARPQRTRRTHLNRAREVKETERRRAAGDG